MVSINALFLALLPLPLLTSALCDSCNSYLSALSTCQSQHPGSKITTQGSQIDAATLSCMCSTNSNDSEMGSCVTCWQIYTDSSFDKDVLRAWTTACRADNLFGTNQAINCWESAPNYSGQCFYDSGDDNSTSNSPQTSSSPVKARNPGPNPQPDATAAAAAGDNTAGAQANFGGYSVHVGVTIPGAAVSTTSSSASTSATGAPVTVTTTTNSPSASQTLQTFTGGAQTAFKAPSLALVAMWIVAAFA